MALEKLTIKAEKSNPGDFADKIEVLFNPSDITMTIPGGKMDKYGLVATEDLTTLSLNLFFDTSLKSYPPENVQNYTKKIVSLT
ncbi:MAG: peptidoglycan-binding LysM, partial [Moorea sp. SIO2B7]|nr:peptidoglycan-binding LysM [Moorena sp. SIO2B7]